MLILWNHHDECDHHSKYDRLVGQYILVVPIHYKTRFMPLLVLVLLLFLLLRSTGNENDNHYNSK